MKVAPILLIGLIMWYGNSCPFTNPLHGHASNLSHFLINFLLAAECSLKRLSLGTYTPEDSWWFQSKRLFSWEFRCCDCEYCSSLPFETPCRTARSVVSVCVSEPQLQSCCFGHDEQWYVMVIDVSRELFDYLGFSRATTALWLQQ